MSQTPQMTELYDRELFLIQDLQRRISAKYLNTAATPENLLSMEREIIQRYHEIGFVVEVDIIGFAEQIQAGVARPSPTISIIDRVTPISEFDYDEKRYEVKKNG